MALNITNLVETAKILEYVPENLKDAAGLSKQIQDDVAHVCGITLAEVGVEH